MLCRVRKIGRITLKAGLYEALPDQCMTEGFIIGFSFIGRFVYGFSSLDGSSKGRFVERTVGRKNISAKREIYSDLPMKADDFLSKKSFFENN